MIFLKIKSKLCLTFGITKIIQKFYLELIISNIHEILKLSFFYTPLKNINITPRNQK